MVMEFKFKILTRYSSLCHFELYPSVNCGKNKKCANLHSNLFPSKNTFTLTNFSRLVNEKDSVIFCQNIFGNLYPRHILGLAGDTGSELVPGESSLETKQQ